MMKDRKEQSAKYYQKHHSEILEKRKIYYAIPEVRERQRAQAKIYYQEHKKEHAEYQKTQYKKNRLDLLEKQKIYYQKNRSRILERTKAYNVRPDVRERRKVRYESLSPEGRSEHARKCKAYRTRPEIREKIKIQNRISHANWLKATWERIFEIYGKSCACCGESNQKFLTVDHIKGGGKEDRKRNQGTKYLQNVAEEANHEKYQILCYNCNIGRYRNGGQCPHQSGVTP